MRHSSLLFIALIGTLFYFSGCVKENTLTVSAELTDKLVPVLPESPYTYTSGNLPAHFTVPFMNFLENTPSNNPITNEGATLGRVLFYDKKLSINNRIACGSCHHQERGFADDERFSTGFQDKKGFRNAMALTNLRYGFRFFWDARAATLEQQVLMPIQDATEMGMSINALTIKLNSTSYYSELFENAFGSSEITGERISHALAQFIRSIFSVNTKYDRGVHNNFSEYTTEELLGKNLFFNSDLNCNQCHSSENFGIDRLNNGLEVDYEDGGIGDLTTSPADDGRFKVPSLRNIELTAPYMHDGRFETLQEVIEHYNSGVQPHPYLDDRLAIDGNTGGPPRQHSLTNDEKEALEAFLKTLTDHELIADERFSDPFK